MALTRLYQFDTGTVLAESDIEGEFDQIYGSALSLVSPLTGNLAAGGFRVTGIGLGAVTDPTVQFTGDTNTGLYSSAADTFDIATGGVRAASFGASFLLNAAPEDARTATVDVAGEIRSTTSGAPAAGIGTGLLFSAESTDENPSSFGEIDFVASDVGVGTEDTYLSILLRAAGAALDEKYRFSSTSGAGFAALFTHAVTADRTYTLPDSDETINRESGTWSDVTSSRALATVYQNTSGKKRRISVYLQGAAADEAGITIQVQSANPPTVEIAVNRNNSLAGAGVSHQAWAATEVPNNHYYRVNRDIGTETLNKWFELDE